MKTRTLQAAWTERLSAVRTSAAARGLGLAMAIFLQPIVISAIRRSNIYMKI